MSESKTTHDAELQATIEGNGSVAHQIIGQFLDTLGKEEGYAQIAARLRASIFADKPSEAALRAALFGDDAL